MSKTPKRIFIAATRQNDGKTTLSLGLMALLKKHFGNIGFIKPIGQRYLVEQGYNIDEDSFLIEEIFGIPCNLKDMSPVAIERGFTKKYIQNPGNKALKKQVLDAFKMVSKGNDIVVIEGTGHAGVGSVFDMSNAVVAKMLDAKVIIVSAGGIGRPIDEVMLSIPLFEKVGVEIAGVIINKVQAGKYRKIDELVRKGFEYHGLKVLGVIPYIKMLDMPTMAHMNSEFKGKFISGKNADLYKPIHNIIIGTAKPSTVLREMKDNNVVIASGDRDDLIKYLLNVVKKKSEDFLRGLVITCGLMPSRAIRSLLEKSNIPALVVEENTYQVITALDKAIVKIQPEEKDKINTVERLVANHLDIDGILKSI
ncbi:MAG: AAA family ATPase [Candidatus Omnitrophota bacterium]